MAYYESPTVSRRSRVDDKKERVRKVHPRILTGSRKGCPCSAPHRLSQKATCMYQLVLRGAGWVSEGVIVAMLLDIGLNWREMLLLLSPFVKKSH